VVLSCIFPRRLVLFISMLAKRLAGIYLRVYVCIPNT